VASVYVIVINREKAYDPSLNQRVFRYRKKTSTNIKLENPALGYGSSSEDEEEVIIGENQQQEYLVNGKSRSMYDSDN